MDQKRLEEIAGELLKAIDVHPPVSAWAIAHWCGFSVVSKDCATTDVRGIAIVYDPAHSPAQREEMLATQIAHWRIARAQEEPCIDAVEYVARALLLPREDFTRDIRRSQDVRELQRVHRYASQRFIEQRMLDIMNEAPALRLVVA